MEAPRASVGTAGCWASPVMMASGAVGDPQSPLLAQGGFYRSESVANGGHGW